MVLLELREVSEDNWRARWKLSPNSIFILDAIDSEVPETV